MTTTISRIQICRKQFELSNHLGNVLVTVSDRKKAISTDGVAIDYFEPYITFASDYYPFGMTMGGRGWSVEDIIMGLMGRRMIMRSKERGIGRITG